MKPIARRISYALLCTAPFVVGVAAGVRALRIPGIYQAIGGVLFAAIATAAWLLGLRAIKAGTEWRQRLALAGGLLVMPFALVSLLWVGLSTPWDATPSENEMRYLVLVVMSIAVTSGFGVLQQALSEAGERLYSTLGFAVNILAGTAYLIWLTFTLGVVVVRLRDGQSSPAIASLSDLFDILLDVACVLTYLATAAFATSLGRTRWLGRQATRAYITANAIALLFLVMRGPSFPNPTAISTPWYIRPGFIVGIPAVPWIMPFLLGVVLLRRAGDEQP